MRSFAAGIQEVVDALAAWIPGGRAAQVVDLAEYAAIRVGKLLEECDDSNGELGDLLGSIGEMHLAACSKARPDPVELAEAFAQDARFEKNWVWFEAHAAEIYARHRGKVYCVAGQELFAVQRGQVQHLVANRHAAAPEGGFAAL